jgi:hypothetical protein
VELAPLPRDRVGPFLLLGAAKDADPVEIEARWAQSVLWARQGKTTVALGDIHWAREVLRDPDRRLNADVASLNTDIAGDELRHLAQRFHLVEGHPTWTPVDPDPPLLRPDDVPDGAAIRATLPTPELTIEFPGVSRWLADFGNDAIDPWSIPFPTTSPQPEDDDE